MTRLYFFHNKRYNKTFIFNDLEECVKYIEAYSDKFFLFHHKGSMYCVNPPDDCRIIFKLNFSKGMKGEKSNSLIRAL